MAKDYSRVQRGQVFWFDPDIYHTPGTIMVKGKEVNSSVQLKRRPVLVVSNNINNEKSWTCNIVPVTSELKPDLPCHVTYEYAGKTQTIEVEQIRTIDIYALGEYICTLNDNVMRKVEEAMVSQFSIRPSVRYLDISLNNVAEHLHELVQRILVEQGAIIAQPSSSENSGIPISAIEDSALCLAETIENLVKKPQVQQPSPVKMPSEKNQSVSMPKLQDDCPNAGCNSVISSENKTRGGGKGRTVTPEVLSRREQYIKDCDTMPIEEVSKKYGIDLDKVMRTKYYYKYQLESKRKRGNISNDK